MAVTWEVRKKDLYWDPYEAAITRSYRISHKTSERIIKRDHFSIADHPALR